MKKAISILVTLFILTCVVSHIHAEDSRPKLTGAIVRIESNKDTLDSLMPSDVPADTKAAVNLGKQAIEHAKAKQWFAFSAGMIWILMFIFKFFRKRIPMMQRINKRWLYIIVCLLSVIAMLLTKFQTDLSWGAAITVLFSGPSVAYANDLLKRGILGKEPSSQ